MDDLSVLKMAVAGLAVVFVGVAKAGFGGGIGLVATPMMALAIAPKDSVGVMLPLLCACDLTAIWHYRRAWDRRNVALLAPGAAAGVALGALALGRFSDHWLGAAIGAVAVAYVAQHALQGLARTDSRVFRPGWPHGTGFGLAAGLTSTLAHAAGPVTAMYLLPQKMDRKRFVGTTVIFYTALNGLKLIPYSVLHAIRPETLKISLFLLPLVPLGVFLGIWMNTRINEKWFNRVVYTVLLLAGIELLQKHLGALV